MTEKTIENLNIEKEEPLISPTALKQLFPLTQNSINTVQAGQSTIKNILHGRDDRQLVVVGPCSIHDVAAAKEYAQRLKALRDEVQDVLYLVMRVYFEKPRTTTGWQGLVIDPYLDNSCQVEEGLKMARELLTFVAELGLPAAGEALDLVTPPYLQDLFSWTAIGARTTESQSHRKMASGLSAVVGFKNGTDGNIDIAVNAIKSVSSPHSFVSIEPNGNVAVIRTSGNPNTHLILRGGRAPNYDAKCVAEYHQKMIEAGGPAGVPSKIMVDCSHANSHGKFARQEVVLQDIAMQLKNGCSTIMGVMLESNLHEGNQPIAQDVATMKYGVSVTDACIGWETTARILRQFAASRRQS